MLFFNFNVYLIVGGRGLGMGGKEEGGRGRIGGRRRRKVVYIIVSVGG